MYPDLIHFKRNVCSLLETPIRLVDGDSEQSGRVEIYHFGRWGTVSDKNFDGYDLEVLCRMLGYTYRCGI